MSDNIIMKYLRNNESIGEVELPFKYTDKVLELGCGETPLGHGENWITHDYRKLPNVDLHFDLEQIPWPINDNTFDGVYGSFIIEHIAWRHTHEFIRECFRILKPGGRCFMIGPNTLEQCKYIANLNRITVDETQMIFGGGDDGGWNSHKAAFSPQSAILAFDKEGFKEIQIREWIGAKTDMTITATKPIESKNINFGSFTVMTPGWLNCDILDLSEYAKKNGFDFRQVDCSKPLQFKSGQIENIISSHMLEHLTRKEGLEFLKECYRILAPGGIIRITVPDAFKLSYEYVNGDFKKSFNNNEGVKTAEDDTLAFWNMLTSNHKTAYDETSLIKIMTEAGFESVSHKFFQDSSSSVIISQTKDMFPDHSVYVEGQKSGKVEESVKEEHVRINEKLNVGLLSTQFFGCPPPGYSGLEQVVWDLANGLSELGHTVTLFAPSGSKAPPNGKLIETGPMSTTVNTDWRALEESAFIKIKDNLGDLDILHGHDWFGYEYRAKALYPNLKVCHTHHGHINTQWWNNRAPFKLNFITISKWMQSSAIKQGFTPEYVYNGIDLDRYQFSHMKSDGFVYVGRISKFKQPHVAIEFAKRLNVNLDIIGGTFVDDQEYLKKIASMCDGKQITFYPDASHDFKVKTIQKSRALLFPSAMGEPFGLVAAEAMACGTPVIALNDGAISEVVEHGVTGFVCNNLDEMLSVCESKDNKPPQIDAISNTECRSRVLTHFSRKVMAENYVKCYEKMMQEGGEW